jgi:hypothetical protein
MKFFMQAESEKRDVALLLSFGKILKKNRNDFCASIRAYYTFHLVSINAHCLCRTKSERSLTQFGAQMHKGDDNSRICCPQGAVSDNTQGRVF